MPYTILDLAAIALRGIPLDSSNSGTISVRVQPIASRDRVLGMRDGALRVSVTAPPHDGKVNAALLELLADTLGVAKSRLRIVRGHSSRDKVVAVEGMSGGGEVQRMLKAATPGETPPP